MKQFIYSLILGCAISSVAIAGQPSNIACPSVAEINSVNLDLPVQFRGHKIGVTGTSSFKLGAEQRSWFVFLGALDNADPNTIEDAKSQIDTQFNTMAKQRRHAAVKLLGCRYTSSQNPHLRLIAVTPADVNQEEQEQPIA